MWYNLHLIDAKQCKIITCKRIEDLALQKLMASPMCTLYRLFKKHLNFEKHIIYIHVTEIEYPYQNSEVQTVNYPFINIYIYMYV